MSENAATEARPRTAPRKVETRSSRRMRDVAKVSFHLHLWFGVISTVLLLIIAITGILLNHKRPLGLMPDIDNEPSGAFEEALPLAELVARASAAVPAEAAAAGVDRMDVRPGDGLVKIRFDDRLVTEATVDLNSGTVLHVGERNDVFLEKLHSGEIFGDNWILLSDLAAVLLVIVLISGYWLWLYPKARA